MPTMGGRYGKYGEVKRLARLRRGRKETRFSKRGSELERGHTRKERARRNRFGGIRPEGEGKE